jgi:DNA-binding IclR family transcriptional regulator
MAAINVSAAAPRVSVEELQKRFLPALLDTAEQISSSLGRQLPGT